MADNFTAEQVDSAGQIFATDQNAGDNAHYPIGKLAWGGLNIFNLTDSVNPFPVKVFGNDSGSEVTITTDSGAPPIVRVTSDSVTKLDVSNSSGAPLFVRGVGSSTVPVSGTVAVSNPSDSTVTVTQAAGSSFQVTHAGLTAIDSAVNSSNELQVKITEIDSQWTGYDANNSALRVNVVAGSAAGSSTVTVTNDSDDPVYVASDTDNPVFVNQVSTLNVAEFAASTVTGALTAFTATVSSAATAVSSAATRLYGYYITNPSTAAFVYLKVYDDSGAVTLGTDVAKMDLGIPPEGAANLTLSPGIGMSSGITVAAAGAGGSTDHTSPDTSLIVTVWHA